MLGMARKDPSAGGAQAVNIPNVQQAAWPADTIPDMCRTREMQIYDGYGGQYKGGRGKSKPHKAHEAWKEYLLSLGFEQVSM